MKKAINKHNIFTDVRFINFSNPFGTKFILKSNLPNSRKNNVNHNCLDCGIQ